MRRIPRKAESQAGPNRILKQHPGRKPEAIRNPRYQYIKGVLATLPEVPGRK